MAGLLQNQAARSRLPESAYCSSLSSRQGPCPMYNGARQPVHSCTGAPMLAWVKTFHIVFMVAWFAGLFYLPRLFVYHTEIAPEDRVNYQRFCTMERRLSMLMSIAAVLTILFGGWLMALYG